MLVPQVDRPRAASRRSSAKATAASVSTVAVLADAEADAEAVGVVAELDAGCPTGEGVLAARHGDEHPLAGRSISNSSIAFVTWSRHIRRKWSAQ